MNPVNQILDEITAMTRVLTHQNNKLHVVLGNLQHLRFSNPTPKEINDMTETWKEEEEFAEYALTAAKQLVERLLGNL